MTKYTFIVMPFGIEATQVAKTEREARKALWAMLSDELRDNCECLDCVDEVPA